MKLLRVALFVFLSIVVVRAAPPASTSMPRATPESQGVSASAIQEFVDQAEQTIDALHSVIIVRHGQVVAEGWWQPYAANEPHMLFSLSKSFTSTAVGLAIAEGKLQLDDPVLKFFPDKAPAEPSDNLKAMRISDLLRDVHRPSDEDIRDFPFTLEEAPWTQGFLHMPVPHKPGTHFLYNTSATYMLSAIVQKVTGQTVLDYLQAAPVRAAGHRAPDVGDEPAGHLARRLRPEHPHRGHREVRPALSPEGEVAGQAARPGRRGSSAATARQTSNGSNPDERLGPGLRLPVLAVPARGLPRRRRVRPVLRRPPEQDAVIAITSGMRDMQAVLNLVWDKLVPALKASALPPNATADKALATKLAALTLPPQTESAASSVASAVAGQRYAFDSNPQTIEWASIGAPASGATTVTLHMDGTDQTITSAPGAWRKSTLRFKGVDDVVASSGGWTASDTYTLKVVRYRTPFITTYRLQFANDRPPPDRGPERRCSGLADARAARPQSRRRRTEEDGDVREISHRGTENTEDAFLARPQRHREPREYFSDAGAEAPAYCSRLALLRALSVSVATPRKYFSVLSVPLWRLPRCLPWP